MKNGSIYDGRAVRCAARHDEYRVWWAESRAPISTCLPSMPGLKALIWHHGCCRAAAEEISSGWDIKLEKLCDRSEREKMASNHSCGVHCIGGGMVIWEASRWVKKARDVCSATITCALMKMAFSRRKYTKCKLRDNICTLAFTY